MSEGEVSKPDVQPVPAIPPTPPDIEKRLKDLEANSHKRSDHWKVPKDWKTYLVIAATVVAYLRGNLTPEQFQASVLNSSVSKTQTTTTETQSGPNPPKIDTAAIQKDVINQTKKPDIGIPASEPHASVLSEFFNTPEGKQLLQIGMEWVRHQFEPKPPQEIPPESKPANPPPIVTHTPPPAPTALKLVLTYSNDSAVTTSTVETGRFVRVMLSEDIDPKLASWDGHQIGNAEVYPLPKQLGLDFQLKDLSAQVGITATVIVNGNLQKLSARISAMQGSQPPPVDNPPIVTNPPPNNPPVPAGSKKFGLFVVEDKNVIRTEATARILVNLTNRNQLASRGHTFTSQFSTDNSAASNYVKQQGTPMPALAIYDNDTKQFVKSVALPADCGLSLLAGMGG